MKSISVLVTLLVVVVVSCEGKFLRRSRYYDDPVGGIGPYDGPYGGGPIAGATGERAILTVRGTRNPYDGSAPAKIAIEDNPYRGPYPRGVYDRLDAGNGYNRRPMYPLTDYGYNGPHIGAGYGGFGGYGGPLGGSGFGAGMYGAPSRIAVTGAYPYGYGSRFGK